MIKTEPQFSICIPCYQDLGGLTKTVQSINACLSKSEVGKFQIIVGLNDCDFGVRQIKSAFDTNWRLDLIAHKTDRYLEYDDSIVFLLSKVKTEFCILLGCGETLELGFSQGLIEFSDQDADFGIVPVDIIDQQLELSSKKSRLAKTDNYWQACERGRFNKVLSGNMFRTAPLHTILKKNEFIGYEWAHVELSLLLQTSLIRIPVIYSNALITRETSGDGWWTKSDLYKQYIEYYELTVSYANKYATLEYLQTEVRRAFGIRLFLMLIQSRSNGLRDRPIFLDHWIAYNTNSRIKLFMLFLIWKTPVPMAKLITAGMHRLLSLKLSTQQRWTDDSIFSKIMKTMI